MQMHVFGAIDQGAGPSGYKTALARAFDDFSSWRRSMRIQCSQKKFNFYGLYREEFGAFLNCKGFNARVVSEWLLDAVTRVVQRDWPGEPRLLNANNTITHFDDRLDLCRVALNHVTKYYHAQR